MTDTSPLIRKLEHGVDLTDADRAILSGLPQRPHRVAAKRDIVREGDPSAGVHLVLERFACRYKALPDGATQIVALLVPGDFCHLHSAILDQADHSIRTLSPCMTMELSHATIFSLLEHPRIARGLWWSSLVDEAILREWLTNLGQRSAEERFAHLLCEMLVRLQAVGLACATTYNFPISQVDLGEILGMSSVHMNRTLQNLRSLGLITYGKKRVEIHDLNRLREICGFDAKYLHLQRGK